MAEFTKGPWIVHADLSFKGKRLSDYKPDNDYAWIGFGESGTHHLVEIDRRRDGNSDYRERAMPDAHLIAAAPELLAACVGMFAQLTKDYGSVDQGNWPTIMPIVEQARAAIQKARTP